MPYQENRHLGVMLGSTSSKIPLILQKLVWMQAALSLLSEISRNGA